MVQKMWMHRKLTVYATRVVTCVEHLEKEGVKQRKRIGKREGFNPKHAPVASHFKVPYALKRNAGACFRVFLFAMEENNIFLTLTLYDIIQN